MTTPKFVTRFINYMYKNYSKDDGKLLVNMGVLGWIFSSIAQLVVVAKDKKIDKKEKKFLFPQEAADAAVNVLMYYTVCEAIKKGSDKLVEKGKILTDKVAEEICKIKTISPEDIKPEDWKNVFTVEEIKNNNLTKLLETPAELDLFKHSSANEQARITHAAQNALEHLETYKNNMGIFSAVGASILACNILTPFTRNFIASKFQNHLLNKEAAEVRKNQIKENVTLKTPLPTSFKAFNNYNAFSNIKI